MNSVENVLSGLDLSQSLPFTYEELSRDCESSRDFGAGRKSSGKCPAQHFGNTSSHAAPLAILRKMSESESNFSQSVSQSVVASLRLSSLDRKEEKKKSRDLA